MTEKKLKRVLIMAGGTGGHVFPGLAVANYLREQGVEVHWLGTNRGLEARVVPEAQLPFHVINIGGVRGNGLKTLLAAPFKIVSAIRQSSALIKKIQPDAVLGMGGFVSGPGGVAAWLNKRPLLIHEQNAKAGLTNKILALFSQRILAGFPSAFKSQPKVIPVGNPVRPEISNLQPRPQSSGFKLLVLGGSLGAKVFNEMLPEALALIPPNERPEIWHQAGDKTFEVAQKNYKSNNIDAKLQPFIKDMSQAYGWADMVLCRAGALTVAELCAAGLGAIFVPYPHAVDDHQTANAAYMVQGDAALCIAQKDLTSQVLADIIKKYSQAPQLRLKMATAAYGLRKTEVTKQIFDIISEVINKK